MPTGLFSSEQRAALEALPEDVSDEARDRFFALSDDDRRFVSRFGDSAVEVALMLGSLRMLGFVPVDLPGSGLLVESVERLEVLRAQGSFQVDLSGLSPNRIRHLARLGRRSRAQAIGRMQPSRRHQVILATLADLVITTTDTLIDLLVIGLAESESRARQSLAKKTTAMATASVDKVRLFTQIAAIILDPEVPDDQIRRHVHQLVTPVALSEAAGEAAEILEPMEGGHLGVWESRYGSLRQFAPKVLAAITFEANPSDDTLLKAVEHLQHINESRQRVLGIDAPTTSLLSTTSTTELSHHRGNSCPLPTRPHTR